VHVQTGIGPDNDNDSIKDWVEILIDKQSALDSTNQFLSTYVSPMCLEGADPYPSLMEVNVVGADQNITSLTPRREPNGRWYVNVPLANAGTVTLQVSYQNGAKIETRQIQWLPVNVLSGGNYNIRRGDKLVLIARPSVNATGRMRFMIGTNQTPSRDVSQQMPCQFPNSGTFAVTGTYTSTNGVIQTGNITVNVTDYNFPQNPDCWVGNERYWDLTNVPPQAVFQGDARLLFESITTLPVNGLRTALLTDENEPRYLVARLGGTNGPVLDSSSVKGFSFWSGNKTYTRVLTNYVDGSQLVEMLLVMSPVISDLTVNSPLKKSFS